MKQITLTGVIPDAMNETVSGSSSELWGRVLALQQGESVLVRAASGHGKTTLCCFLSGLRQDYAGSISFDSKDIRTFKSDDWSAVRCSQLAVMYQDLKLFDELTAVENVQLKAALTPGISTGEITELLARTGLDSKTVSRPVGTLSLGQQQRVAFVRMLIQPAQFRLLDEPVSHLDPGNAAILAQMLAEKCSNDGSAVIVTSTGYDLPYKYDRTILM